ncbi:hypothetical protein BOX15_Mlig022726g1 [Macrostomum lignano]|uniref:CRAL-TRIO domain-containing protein n=1 Tax=Macrostomum lignano TaxID=282301 RepID=A0A267GJI4_9PLAT|nr:hypothetical protein BOX15_Mlig022726g1 [Macrostomum lignano]
MEHRRRREAAARRHRLETVLQATDCRLSLVPAAAWLSQHGISLPACNPRLGYSVTQVFSNFYPERLGKVFCVNHSGLFHGVWCAIQRFLHPATAAKMKMLRGKSKIRDTFEAWFPADLADWLLEEMRLNRSRKHLPRQRQFWRGSAPGEAPDEHDPRGCAEYVAKYVEAAHPSGHLPHPNIVAHREGRLQQPAAAPPPMPSSSSAASLQSAASGAAADFDDEEQLELNGAAAAAALEIPEEFAIPEGAEVMTN